jgi:hypothetical protein
MATLSPSALKILSLASCVLERGDYTTNMKLFRRSKSNTVADDAGKKGKSVEGGVGGKKSRSLKTPTDNKRNSLLTVDDDDMSSVTSLEVDNYVSSVAGLRRRKGGSKAEFKTWVRNVIKIQQKCLVQNEQDIQRTKGQINFERNWNPNSEVTMDTFRNMRRIQGFEAELGKAKYVVSTLQYFLIVIDKESNWVRAVLEKYEREIFELLSKPAVRPTRV